MHCDVTDSSFYIYYKLFVVFLTKKIKKNWTDQEIDNECIGWMWHFAFSEQTNLNSQNTVALIKNLFKTIEGKI